MRLHLKEKNMALILCASKITKCKRTCQQQREWKEKPTNYYRKFGELATWKYK